MGTNIIHYQNDRLFMKTSEKAKFNYAMVIDDLALDLFITSRLTILAKFCNNILGFRTAKEGLLYLEENKDRKEVLPEVIFLDIYMPLMSGFAFVEEFERFPTEVKNHCRIYMFSATVDKSDLIRAKKNKTVVGFYEKPLSPQHLATINAR